MSRNKKKQKKKSTVHRLSPGPGVTGQGIAAAALNPPMPIPQDRYREAADLAVRGRHDAARTLYEQVEKSGADARTLALVRNDLAVLRAVDGDAPSALRDLEAALVLDQACEPARLNLTLLQEDLRSARQAPVQLAETPPPAPKPAQDDAVKIAILSFLFNWPSTGGGIVHTVELAQFLGKAGYEV
jgi:hypothetical protein